MDALPGGGRESLQYDHLRPESGGSYSGVHWNIVHNRSMAVKAEEELSLRILMDRYTVEIFAEGGAKVFSALIYTENEAEGIFFESDGEAVMDVTAKEIVLEEK